VLLRLEGLAVLVGSLVLYFHADFGWPLLVVLFFAPDLSFVAYTLGPHLGAVAYDALHTRSSRSPWESQASRPAPSCLPSSP
jgi:hypothetical protein